MIFTIQDAPIEMLRHVVEQLRDEGGGFEVTLSVLPIEGVEQEFTVTLREIREEMRRRQAN